MTGLSRVATTRRGLLRAVLASGLAASVAGCSQRGTEASGTTTVETTPPTPAPLSIDRFAFASDRPTGYREYAAVEDRRFAAGDEVWTYFEPGGVSREAGDDGPDRIDLRVGGSVTPPGGLSRELETRAVSRDVANERSLEELYLWYGFPLGPAARVGEWELTLRVVDEVSGQSVESVEPFRVEDGPRSYVAAFEAAIRSESDVTLQRLASEDGTVSLAYRSAHETGTQDWRGEIAFLAGVFAGVVSQGWEAQRLEARTTGTASRVRTWHVTRDLAVAFATEEVGNDTFVRRVLETVESA